MSSYLLGKRRGYPRTKSIFAVFLVFLLVFTPNAPAWGATSNPQSTQVATLDFTPSDTLLDPDRPVLYLTDKDNKKIYALNYQTGQTTSIQLSLPPEKLAYANDELYVTLLITGHQYVASSNLQGSIAIINTQTFTLKEQFNIDTDPSDIAVDTNRGRTPPKFDFSLQTPN